MRTSAATLGATLALLCASVDAPAQSVPEDTPKNTTDDLAGAPTPDATISGNIVPLDCTPYGEGYMPMPGTSTCLRIGGYIRLDSGFGDLNGLDTDGPPDGEADTFNQSSRFALNTYTSSETALGTLNTFTEVRFNYANTIEEASVGDVAEPERTSTTSTSLNFGWVELGGLRFGKGETLFDTFTGYGGAVISDTTIGGYGPFDTEFVQYTYTGDAIGAAVGLENLAGDSIIDDYVPHVVLGLGGEAAGIALRSSFAFDTRDDDAGGYTAKLRGDYSFSDTASVFLMGLYGENESGYTTWATGEPTDDTFSLMGGHSAQMSDRFASNSQLQWVQGNDVGDDLINVVANVAWQVVAGLAVTPELQYVRDADGEDLFGGVLRAQGTF